MSPYSYEPPNALMPYSGTDFDHGVRNAFQNMGRVDVTPLAIPWSGIDVPMVDKLPQSPNDKAEVNLLLGGSVSRMVYLKATNRWYCIGGKPTTYFNGDAGTGYTVTTTVASTALDSTNLSHTVYCTGSGKLKVTIAFTANKATAGYGIVGFNLDGTAYDARGAYIESGGAVNRHYTVVGVVNTPPSFGAHTLEVTAWKSGAGDLSIYNDAPGADLNRVEVVAEEL